MQIEKKYFLSEDSMLNADDAPFAVSPNSWINAENVRTGSTDKGFTGTVESIGGTLLISQPQPSVNYSTIGTIEDSEYSRFIKFQYNTTGRQDKIVCYYADTNIEYDVLLSSQVTGGLNFSNFSLIHSAQIINGYLYWVDGTNNEPRKINIEASIKANYPSFTTTQVAYTFPLNFSEITIIKPPPPLAPEILKVYDSFFNNNYISNQSFEAVYQYIFYDNETTVVGTYSPATRLNSVTDTYNYIQVTMDFREVIPNTVRFVNLIIRLSNTNNAIIVKSWDREVSSENDEINDQSDNVAPLRFDFYNNISGESISPLSVLKPFDSVPIYSQALSSARNRLFLGNNIEGYNTPATTSLTASASLFTTGGTAVKPVIAIRNVRGTITNPQTVPFDTYIGWYVYITEINPVGYYLVNGTEVLSTSFTFALPALTSPPASIAFGSLTFKGALTQVMINTFYYGILDKMYGNATYGTINVTGITSTIYNTFPQLSTYNVGIVFYDYALRKTGVKTNNGLIVDTQVRNYAYTNIVTGIDWELSNASAVDEIPEKAYYYSVVRTLNLIKRFFIQSICTLLYATRWDGKYLFVDEDYNSSATVAIGLNTTQLNEAGLGYVYSEGDVCVIINPGGSSYILSVIGQDGNFIVLNAQDVGNTHFVAYAFEIYSPHKTTEQEPYFEVGQLNRITNPNTANRQYETLYGTLRSDSYLLSRHYWNNATINYVCGAMSPNDLYYKQWDNDGGKVNIITKLGQAIKTQYIRWSDTLIPNTSVNGLSTFDALNQKPVPADCGEIQKLILTSKTQAEGTVMLSVCTIETNSMYLGEVQITDSTGVNQFFSSSDNVIGTINTLKGSYGTVDPASVVEYRGSVFFFSANTGKVIQYASNGLFPISNYKMTRFWKLFSELYLSMSKEEIEALGSRPFVFATVDPHHNELLITIPKLSNTPTKGYLPDYPSKIFPFDIWDAQAKTIAYKLDTGLGRPKFLGSYSFTPEYYITLLNQLYGFKYGHTYLHNQTENYNEFYGVQYSSKIMIISNQLPNKPKMYDNISVESNLVPNFCYFYNNYPIQQSSDLVDEDFTEKEGVFFSTIKRNKLVPTATGYTTDGLLIGVKMRNVAMWILLEWRVTTEPLELKYINIGYSISKGVPT